MNYLLLILTSILGILGTILDTHNEEEVNGKKRKTISGWGIFTVISLIMLMVLSLVKQYKDDKGAEDTSREAAYLELSALTVGPDYRFRINFTDSLFLTDTWKKVEEMEYAEQQEYELALARREDTSTPVSLMNYSDGFFDSLSRNTLFRNKQYVNRSNLARITFSPGILDGYIDFCKDGRTIGVMWANYIKDDNPDNTIDTETSFLYTKAQLTLTSGLPKAIKAGTIYSTILRQYKRKASPANITVYFDRKPNPADISDLEGTLGKIMSIELLLSYDIDAYRWFVISMVPNGRGKFEKSSDGKNWVFSKKFKYEKLPYIESIAKD